MLTSHAACLSLPPDHVGLSKPFLAPGIPIAYAQVIPFYLYSQIRPSSLRSLHRYSFYLEWAFWCQPQKTPAYFSRLSWPITFYLGAFRAFSLPHAPHLPGVFCSWYSPGVFYSSLLQHVPYFVKYCLCDAVSFILPWAPLRVWPCRTHLRVPRASSPVPPPHNRYSPDIHRMTTIFNPQIFGCKAATVCVTAHSRPSLQRITQTTTDHVLGPLSAGTQGGLSTSLKINLFLN